MAGSASANKQRKSVTSGTSSTKRASQKQRETAEEDVFTIDKIIDYREDANEGPRWRIRWTNYTPADDTWEPAENIIADDKKLNADMARLQKEFREKQRGGSPKSAGEGLRKSVKGATSGGSAPRGAAKKEEVKVRGKQRKISSSGGGGGTQSSTSKTAETKMRVAHIRRYPDRDDDFQCVLVGGEGDSQILPVSEARGQYYNELIDYLLKRVKFLENTNA